jgi:hypothetical protein
MKYLLLLFALTLPGFFFLYGCKKKSTTPTIITPSLSQYTSKMGGTRIWKGMSWGETDSNGISFPLHPFNYTINDTFAISILSDSTVQIWNNAVLLIDSCTFMFDSWDTGSKAIIYSGSYSERSITYYYDADSITILEGYWYGHNGWDSIRLVTQ